MKKRWPIAVAAVLIVAVASYWMYLRFLLPVWTWETNSSGEPPHSRLVKDSGVVYGELDWPYGEDYQPGRQIARTTEGFRIYRVKGHAGEDLVLLTGLMMPPVVFIKE